LVLNVIWTPQQAARQHGHSAPLRKATKCRGGNEGGPKSRRIPQPSVNVSVMTSDLVIGFATTPQHPHSMGV
jgi:hypothetical protein